MLPETKNDWMVRLSDYWTNYRELNYKLSKAVKHIRYTNGSYPKLVLATQDNFDDAFRPECPKCKSREVDILLLSVDLDKRFFAGVFTCQKCNSPESAWPFGDCD